MESDVHGEGETELSKKTINKGVANSSEASASLVRCLPDNILRWSRTAFMLGCIGCLGSSALAASTDTGSGGGSTATFRPGGNLSLFASVQQTSWDVREAGVVVGQRAWAASGSLSARYAFHFQILSKFGGVVGTETAFSYENTNIGANLPQVHCSTGGLRPGPSFSFPSLLLGVVQNFRSDRRAMLLAQYTSTWYPWMQTCGGQGNENQMLSAMPHTISLGLGVDVFRKSSSAWSVGAGYRTNFIRCVGTPASCELSAQKTSALERLSIVSKGIWLQAGMSWLLGVETQ